METIAPKKTIVSPLVVVIGSSRFGANLAYENSSQGYYTTLIDKNKDAFKKVDPNYSGFFLEGDATETEVLEKAHIRDAWRCVIATEDDSVNIYVASLVAMISKVSLIIVRLHDERKACLLHDRRIHIISPSLLSYEAYESILTKEGKRP
jgi:trk system potassium uptake protein TrkA